MLMQGLRALVGFEKGQTEVLGMVEGLCPISGFKGWTIKKPFLPTTIHEHFKLFQDFGPAYGAIILHELQALPSVLKNRPDRPA